MCPCFEVKLLNEQNCNTDNLCDICQQICLELKLRIYGQIMQIDSNGTVEKVFLDAPILSERPRMTGKTFLIKFILLAIWS